MSQHLTNISDKLIKFLLPPLARGWIPYEVKQFDKFGDREYLCCISVKSI